MHNEIDSTRKLSLVVKNASFLVVGRMIANLLYMALVVIIARKLESAQFGAYTLAITISSIFLVIADFGNSYLTTREIAKDKINAGKYLLNGTIIKLLLNGLFFTLFFVFIRFMYSGAFRLVLYLACILGILKVYTQFYNAFFNGYERMYYTALVFIAESVLVFGVYLLILVGPFYNQSKILGLLFGHIIASGIIALCSLLILVRFLRIRFSRFDVHFSWNFIKRSIPFGLGFIGGIIYFQSDTIILSILQDKSAVGFYQAAIRLIMIVEVIPAFFTGAMYPTISKAFANPTDDAKPIVERSLRYMLLIGLPIAPGMILLSKQIITLFYGSQYMPAVLILQILAFMIPIRYCGHVLGTSLSASDNQGLRTITVWVSSVVNVSFNLFMIPRYSYNGAAIANVVASSIVVGCYYYLVKRKFYQIPIWKISASPLGATLIMSGILYWLRNMSLPFVISIAIGIYLFSLIALKGLNKNDYQVVKDVFTRNAS